MTKINKSDREIEMHEINKQNFPEKGNSSISGGREFEHVKDKKARSSKVSSSLEVLKKVGLDVKYKTASMTPFEITPDQQTKDALPTEEVKSTKDVKTEDKSQQVKSKPKGLKTLHAKDRKIEHVKNKKPKHKKIHLSLDDLQKVGLDVKYKTASMKSTETTPTEIAEKIHPTQKNHESGQDLKTHSKKEDPIEIKKESKEGVYIPKKVLEKRGEGAKFKSIQESTKESMLSEKSPFAKAKPASVSNLQPPDAVVSPQAFPKKSLTRMLTGDVKPEWIVGLGKMKSDKITPEEGYRDCFVSSLEEYEKKGIQFDPSNENNPVDMAGKLDLMPSDIEKIEKHGAWIIEIHPSSKLAIPTERKSQWNPGYVEGGYTGSGQQEWVTPNIAVNEEARAGRIKIYKMSPDGKTIEWKFFKGTLYPNIPNDTTTGPVVGSYNHAIDTHIKSIKKTKS